MVRRVLLFIAVNFLVMITISVILNVLGIRPYLTENGIDYESLLAFCLVWGMGGAFISLGLSRIMAKMAMGVQVIDPAKAGAGERELDGGGRRQQVVGDRRQGRQVGVDGERAQRDERAQHEHEPHPGSGAHGSTGQAGAAGCAGLKPFDGCGIGGSGGTGRRDGGRHDLRRRASPRSGTRDGLGGVAGQSTVAGD